MIFFFFLSIALLFVMSSSSLLSSFAITLILVLSLMSLPSPLFLIFPHYHQHQHCHHVAINSLPLPPTSLPPLLQPHKLYHCYCCHGHNLLKWPPQPWLWSRLTIWRWKEQIMTTHMIKSMVCIERKAKPKK